MALIPTNSVGGYSTGLTMTNVIDSGGNISGVAGVFTGTLTGATASFSKLLTASAGLSAAGATFSGNISAPNIVNSFNGLTGAVTGVTAGGANTFTALNTFSAGLSAAGGVTFSGTFSGATASFSKLLSASAGVSASALTVTTTGTTNKTSAITMASGVTASNSVTSQITLNAYNADAFTFPTPAPYTRTGYITANSDYDLKLQGGGDSYIGIAGDSISIGDIDGANNSARISFDTTEYVTVTGKLSASSGVFTDSVVASAGLYNEGTLYINCDWNNTGEGGGNSITHIGDLAGDVNNTFITVNDSTGNITVNASNGTVALSGVVTVNSQVVSTNARGWFL